MNSVFCTNRAEVVSLISNNYLDDLKKDVLEGMTAAEKFIPSKYFYDTYGSILFETISSLPEYYLTRTELSILKNSAAFIMENFLEGDVVELGPGANGKVRILLDEAYKSHQADIRYVPIDVSESAILKISRELLDVYPLLKVFGIVADFTKYIEDIRSERTRLLMFLGSTIGNFCEKEGVDFLKNIARSMRSSDRFLLGMDMVKRKEILELAYNDSRGITSEFNKNVLNVVNRELDANFCPDYFIHCAFFNAEKEQIEMYLEADREISVEIKALNLHVEIRKGERIRTEISRKFSKDNAKRMVNKAGLTVNRWFSDPRGWFSLAELVLPK